MKRISFLLVALLMMGGMVMAQGPRRGGQDMDPKTRAERMTERMAKEYSLNETQKKELLEVNMAFVQKMGERPGRMKPEMSALIRNLIRRMNSKRSLRKKHFHKYKRSTYYTS